MKSWQGLRLDTPRTIFANNLGERMPENEANMEESKTEREREKDRERSNDFTIF